jgi:hypothetical protein
MVKKYSVLVILIIFMLATVGCTSAGTKSPAEASVGSAGDYKAGCKEISVTDLTQHPGTYAGQKVKVMGMLGGWNYTHDTHGGEVILLRVLVDNPAPHDELTKVVEVCVFFPSQKNAYHWVPENITVYGEFSGKDYCRPLDDDIIAPRINAVYVDVETPEYLKGAAGV